ncbi:MAG: hypothetical protein IIB00_02610 [candidate division Zixibacteria bacterium]|nr:hypothetical protein [candidate division Zixibacteria bacterium]
MTTKTNATISTRNIIRMSASLALGALVLIAAFPVDSYAQSGMIFGNLQMARTIGDGATRMGGAFVAGDEATTFYATGTHGLGMFTEGTLRLGLSEADYPGSDPEISIGAELKYQFWNFEGQNSRGQNIDDPIDLAFTGFFEHVSHSLFKVTSFGGGVIASKPFKMNDGKKYGPYARAAIRLTTLDPKNVQSDTDFKFSLTPGGMVQLTRTMNVHAEFNFDDNTSFALGIDFLVD